MTIRAAAKAVIIRDGEILLQCCHDDEFLLDYYELPGGGQNPMETIEQAILRECLEETGYEVEIVRFLALSEEIITIPSVQRQFPDHAHRIFHIFLCRIKNAPRQAPSEEDTHQTGLRWFPIHEVAHMRLRPTNLRSAIAGLVESRKPAYLGTSILDSFDF